MADDPLSGQVDALGQFIHAQRKLAKLSLRELAALTDLSNAYLSQLERGLHQPSMRVVMQLSRAFGVTPETFLRQAGLLDGNPPAGRGSSTPSAGPAPSAEEAIRTDPSLTAAQREALLAVYRSFSEGTGTAEAS
jgi:transcriptional regulator with XRE-family HTH domain